VEGDAVFAWGRDAALVPRAALLETFDEAFAAFRTRQRALEADESCDCRACRSVGTLDLKIVAHHGRFLRQSVGGRRQVAGADVILAHQLLKNRVGKRAYVLLTEATVAWLELDAAQSGLSTHVERYDHLGEVRCFVRDVELPVAVERELIVAA
jgi:hypothetical protein